MRVYVYVTKKISDRQKLQSEMSTCTSCVQSQEGHAAAVLVSASLAAADAVQCSRGFVRNEFSVPHGTELPYTSPVESPVVFSSGQSLAPRFGKSGTSTPEPALSRGIKKIMGRKESCQGGKQNPALKTRSPTP